MTENLTDTNVGNIEYIRKEDALDAISCDITITGKENAEIVCKAIASFADGIKALEPADVVSKADIAALLDETEKELVKDTDKYSIAYNFIVAVIGIIKCKIMQMGEKDDK